MKTKTAKPAGKPMARKPAAKQAKLAAKRKAPGTGKPNLIQRAQEVASEDATMSLWREDLEADKAEHGGNQRPTVYTPTIGARILAWIASGQKMATLWSLPGIPSEPLFYKWLTREGKDYDRLREGLVRAREARAAIRPARIEEIAERLVAAPEAGQMPLHPQAAKVYIDAQHLLAQLESPKVYGKSLTLRGDKENPVHLRSRHDLTEAELEALLRGGVDDED